MDNRNWKGHYSNYNLKGSVMAEEQFKWVLLVFWWSNCLFRLIFREIGKQLNWRMWLCLPSPTTSLTFPQITGEKLRLRDWETEDLLNSDMCGQLQENSGKKTNNVTFNMFSLPSKKCDPKPSRSLTTSTTRELSFPPRGKVAEETNQKNYCPILAADVEEFWWKSKSWELSLLSNSHSESWSYKCTFHTF